MLTLVMPIHMALKDKALDVFRSQAANIYFRKVGDVLVVACDPVACDMDDKLKAWVEFCGFANSQNLKICGYYFSQEFSCRIRKKFKVYQAGVCTTLKFNKFSLSGGASKEVRRGINHKTNKKWWVQKIESPEKKYFFREVKELEKKWINSKGPFKIYFLLSRIHKSEGSIWYALRDKNSKLIAFVSLYKVQGNFYLDQMIQGTDSPKMALNALISDIILKLLTSGVENLSFGFNAFINIPKRSFFERMLSLVGGMPAFYNARGIYNFKKKYTNYEESRFLIIQKDLSYIKALCSLFLATFKSYSPKLDFLKNSLSKK